MSEFKKGDRVRVHNASSSYDGKVYEISGILGARVALNVGGRDQWFAFKALMAAPSANLSDPTLPEPLLVQLDRVSERVRNEDAEVRTTSSTGAEKGVKAEAYSLIPTEAWAVVARHYGVGAKKYSAHNWRKGYPWSYSHDSAVRHLSAFWGGEDIDAETGSPHPAAVIFHMLTLLTFMDEQPGFDDRYKQEAWK